jgi:hypothetical protein
MPCTHLSMVVNVIGRLPFLISCPKGMGLLSSLAEAGKSMRSGLLSDI